MNRRIVSIVIAALLIALAAVPTAVASSRQYSAFQIANNLFGSGKYYGSYKTNVTSPNANRTYTRTEQAKVTGQDAVTQAPPEALDSAPVRTVSGGGSNAPSQDQLAPAGQEQGAKAEGNAVNAAGLSAQEKEMVQYINEERQKAGLKPLQVDVELSRGARMKSQDMVDKGYFAHNSPTYGSPFDMMKSLGIKYRAAGENIARNGSVLKAHVSLMNSEGHRKNILNPNYTHVGVGIVGNSGMGGITVTQWFIAK